MTSECDSHFSQQVERKAELRELLPVGEDLGGGRMSDIVSFASINSCVCVCVSVVLRLSRIHAHTRIDIHIHMHIST